MLIIRKKTSQSIFLNLSCCCLETGLKPSYYSLATCKKWYFFLGSALFRKLFLQGLPHTCDILIKDMASVWNSRALFEVHRDLFTKCFSYRFVKISQANIIFVFRSKALSHLQIKFFRCLWFENISFFKSVAAINWTNWKSLWQKNVSITKT